jgi:hypothetical protein
MARPRSAGSPLGAVELLAKRWDITIRAAQRLAERPMDDDAMAVLVNQIKREMAMRRGELPRQGKYVGGLAACGMPRSQRVRNAVARKQPFYMKQKVCVVKSTNKEESRQRAAPTSAGVPSSGSRRNLHKTNTLPHGGRLK